MLENIERSGAGRLHDDEQSHEEQASATAASTTGVRARWLSLATVVVVALAIWLPRAFQLDHFVTIDEGKWLVRSANFYQAVTTGDLFDTFQHGHPGVMVMYAGMMGYLWQFPDYVHLEPVQHQWGDTFMMLLESYNIQPIEMLEAGRTFIVLFNVVVLSIAFVYARRLFGLWPALLAFMLIAFDPFHAALSRFMHPDSLLSTFMLPAMLAFMTYLFAGQKPRDLIAAGIFTGLSGLTKTPAIFLAPWLTLMALIGAVAYVANQPGWRWSMLRTGAALRSIPARMLRPIVIAGGIALVVFVALWPALWVEPQWTIAEVLDISTDYAEQGHTSPIFFNGRVVNGDPGFWFYPINYLWRTTPVIMAGMGLLLLSFFLPGSLTRRRRAVLSIVGLACAVVFFDLFVNLSAKKFDRYLLPVFMPMDILAALGWAGVAGWVLQRLQQNGGARWGQGVVGLILAGAIGWQAWLAYETYPYYMTYYNPAMGGPEAAGEVMIMGWGEGLDEAARYLNREVDVQTASVAAWYERGPFSFFYDGPSTSNRYVWDSDYAVVYEHQWQRQLPSRRMLAYFDTLEPIHAVTLNDIEYARIYDMREVSPAPYSVEWGEKIRLVYYDTYSGAMYPGQRFDMTIYWTKQAPMDINYNIKYRLVNAEGHELMKLEGWPEKTPTSGWEIDEVLRDNDYEVDIPEDTPPGLYRMEISFYDPATLTHLQGVQVATGNPVSDPYVLDYLVIGDWPPKSKVQVNPPVDLGGLVNLTGAERITPEGRAVALDNLPVAPGDSMQLRLHWHVQDYIHTDYTTFVQVLGPDGAIVEQADGQPLDGFLPTSYWPLRERIADNYTITLPDDAAPGEYRVLVGWYDLETMERLPMSRRGQVFGDAYQVGEFTVQP